MNTSQSKKKRAVYASLVSIALFLLTAGGFSFWRIKSEGRGVRDDDPEVAVMMDRVAKVVALPDERPTIAIVTDSTRLEQTSFFASAENGDRVIIFSGAGRAILYRPSTGAVLGETTVTAKP